MSKHRDYQYQLHLNEEIVKDSLFLQRESLLHQYSEEMATSSEALIRPHSRWRKKILRMSRMVQVQIHCCAAWLIQSAFNFGRLVEGHEWLGTGSRHSWAGNVNLVIANLRKIKCPILVGSIISSCLLLQLHSLEFCFMLSACCPAAHTRVRN